MVGNTNSTFTLFSLISTLIITMALTNDAKAQDSRIERECSNGVCGESEYVRGKVYIRVFSKVPGSTHLNFKTNPGQQIEIRDSYSFNSGPGITGTYSVQSCTRGFLSSSTCRDWATFRWTSSSNPTKDLCKLGYVWREAQLDDRVCVTPAVRSQSRNENTLAASRREPNGGPYGPDTCKQGYVWREATPSDRVCVTPQVRSQAANDNNSASSRRAN
jgi:hypothetical protein